MPKTKGRLAAFRIAVLLRRPIRMFDIDEYGSRRTRLQACSYSHLKRGENPALSQISWNRVTTPAPRAPWRAA